MDQKFKDLNQGRKFLMRTLGKLLNAGQAQVMSMLALLTTESVAAVASKIRVLKIKKGV